MLSRSVRRFVRKGLKGCAAATERRDSMSRSGGAGARERGAPQSPVGACAGCALINDSHSLLTNHCKGVLTK
jgi:hypothetical protein